MIPIPEGMLPVDAAIRPRYPRTRTCSHSRPRPDPHRVVPTDSFPRAGRSAAGGPRHQHNGTVRRPNVLLITLDQFRADCLGAAGHPVVRTPTLDRLAADGVSFTHHFSNCAPCAPGRASLLTGLWQIEPPRHRQRRPPGRRPAHAEPRAAVPRLPAHAVRLHRHRAGPAHAGPGGSPPEPLGAAHVRVRAGRAAGRVHRALARVAGRGRLRRPRTGPSRATSTSRPTWRSRPAGGRRGGPRSTTPSTRSRRS